MHKALLLVICCCFFACKKEGGSAPATDPVLPATISYRLTDSVFTRSGGSVDSNHNYVPFSVITATHIDVLQPVLLDTLSVQHYCVVRADTFFWRSDLKEYGKLRPRNVPGDYVTIGFKGDTLSIFSHYQTWQTWSETYAITGVRN